MQINYNALVADVKKRTKTEPKRLLFSVTYAWCFNASSLTYRLYDLTEQARSDPAGETGIPRLVIVIGVVVIVITIIVVVVTTYLVRKHRRQKAPQAQKKPVEAQEEISVWDCEIAKL